MIVFLLESNLVEPVLQYLRQINSEQMIFFGAGVLLGIIITVIFSMGKARYYRQLYQKLKLSKSSSSHQLSATSNHKVIAEKNYTQIAADKMAPKKAYQQPAIKKSEEKIILHENTEKKELTKSAEHFSPHNELLRAASAQRLSQRLKEAQQKYPPKQEAKPLEEFIVTED